MKINGYEIKPYADLKGADLRYANLEGADLEGADLTYTNLKGADLLDADLTGADLDFSCLPLWCGSFNMKVDDKFISQLICHITRLNTKNCNERTKEIISKLDEYKNDFCNYRSDIDKI